MSFKRFDPEDIVISAETVTTPVWTGDLVELQTFVTSSTQTNGASADYYYNIYQQDPTTEGARVQFAVTYGDKQGSGSIQYNVNVDGKSPSSTIFGQYRNLVLGDEETDFSFGGVTSEYFFVISVDRARYREKLLPGTFELHLTSGSNSISLIDNSSAQTTVTYTDAGRVYELVTGSLTGTPMIHPTYNNYGYTNGFGSYGKFLPDIGVILLNGKALDASTGVGGIEFNTDRNTDPLSDNYAAIFNAISSSAYFRLQAEETISSNYIFIRARNSEFNYSTNPSVITGSGELRHSVMINTPQSYITTVGLYNDNNDLLAVAKLSRPLLKDFTKEALIRVKLDY